MKSTILKWLLASAAVCLFSGSVLADSLTLGIENDVFLHDDSDYSHGTQIIYKHDSPNAKYFDAWGIDLLQDMYTPDNISSTEIQYGDRPYCGLLLASWFGDTLIPAKYGDLNLRNEFGIGSTGPNSFAQDSQKVVHSIIGSRKPKGWDHQIAQEFIVQYQGYADFNTLIVNTDYFKMYNILRGAALVGTYKDMLSLGLDLKFGLNPKENIGSNIAFSAPRGKKMDKFSLSLLVGAEGRFVIWDTSLDGTLFRDCEYTVDSEKLVGELHTGASLGIGPVKVDFLVIFRTREYKSQDESPDYARLAVTFDF